MLRMTKGLALCALLMLPLAAAADELVSLKLGYASLSPSGRFAGNLAGSGTQVDLEQTLGFGRSNNVTAEAALQFGDSRLSLGYLPLSFDGSGVLGSSVVFNGRSFNVGNRVSSRIKADIFDVAYTYYVINMDDTPSRIQLGVELAVKITKAEASMNNPSLGVSEAVAATVPIPTLGLRGRVALADFLGLVGRAGYLGYAGNRFLDADVQLEFSPLPAAGVFAGYRYLDVKVDSSGTFVDARFSGPYAGGFLRF